jgi:hypothetical protein
MNGAPLHFKTKQQRNETPETQKKKNFFSILGDGTAQAEKGFFFIFSGERRVHFLLKTFQKTPMPFESS